MSHSPLFSVLWDHNHAKEEMRLLFWQWAANSCSEQLKYKPSLYRKLAFFFSFYFNSKAWFFSLYYTKGETIHQVRYYTPPLIIGLLGFLVCGPLLIRGVQIFSTETEGMPSVSSMILEPCRETFDCITFCVTSCLSFEQCHGLRILSTSKVKIWFIW